MDVVMMHSGARSHYDPAEFEPVPLSIDDAISATGADPIDIDDDGFRHAYACKCGVRYRRGC